MNKIVVYWQGNEFFQLVNFLFVLPFQTLYQLLTVLRFIFLSTLAPHTMNSTAFSQINTSTSKAMYSFGKSCRPSPAKKVYCDRFYNIPQTKTHRQASIGYGKKVDISSLNKAHLDLPPPGSYNPPNFISINKNHHKGFSIGIGRQETKNQSFVQFDKSVPGPQKYNPQLNKIGPRYSFRKRFESEIFVKNSSKFIPGPGCYDSLNSLNPEGKYWIGKWKSSRAKRFNPKSSSRFAQTKTEVPGPGKYTPRNSIWSDNGCVTESKYVSCGNRVFSKGSRNTIFDDATKKQKGNPGPGMYQSFSDFGSIPDWTPKKNFQTVRLSTSGPQRA